MEIKEACGILEDLQRILTQYRYLSTNLTVANGIAIEALEKKEEYRWHDLRKNPEDLPKEKDSIFAKYKNTDKWNDAMCEKYSESVLVCFEFPDNSRIIKQTTSKDGKFKYDYSRILSGTAIAWKYIEPFEEGDTDDNK